MSTTTISDPELLPTDVSPVSRWYMDTRAITSSTGELPLIQTLRTDDQTKIRKFVRVQDRYMSLGSTLLKYVFIHRRAQIPWSQIEVSTWPKPHQRPYWDPPADWTKKSGLEFNVSHQAGLVALIGCETPEARSSAHNDAENGICNPKRPRLGIDVTCTAETNRTTAKIKRDADFTKWVETFPLMFSDQEREYMKGAPIMCHGPRSPGALVLAKLRRFYAYWALKEAYVKMVGEGLQAPWLAELEFGHVEAPPALAPFFELSPSEMWGANLENIVKNSDDDFTVTLYGKIVKAVRMELSSYQDIFILATSVSGLQESATHPNRKWSRFEIDTDIRACAEGRCSCLDGRAAAADAAVTDN